MIMRVYCEVCGKGASWYSIEHPNPERTTCECCGHSWQSLTIHHSFCSWGCLKKFVSQFIEKGEPDES